MRRLFIALIALVGMGATGLAFAGPAIGNGLKDSPHDFTDNNCWNGTYTTAGDETSLKVYVTCDESSGTTAWNDTKQLCAVCHVPHSFGDQAATFRDVGLLWNHAEDGINSWTAYASPTLEDDVAGTDPSGASLACLACHDGITAIDAFGEHVSSPTQNIILGAAGGRYDSDGAGAGQDAFARLVYGDAQATNNDISHEHPIGMQYLELQDTNLKPQDTAYGGRTVADFLYAEDRVQCGSCHDVHDSGIGFAPGSGNPGEYLLREPIITRDGGTDGRASKLCLGCHKLDGT